MIPAGTYKGRAIAGSEQYGHTSNGNEQIVIDLQLQMGDSETLRLSTFLYFSEKAAPYSIERLRALGWQGDDLADLRGIDANEVDVQIAYEMYDGQQRIRVQILTGGGRVTLDKPMGPNERKAFGARFRALAKGISAGGGAPAQTGAPAQAAPRPANGRRGFAGPAGPERFDEVPDADITFP